MDQGQFPLVPELLQRVKSRGQTKLIVEHFQIGFLEGQVAAYFLVVSVPVRHHCGEPVQASSEENEDQLSATRDRCQAQGPQR